MGAELDSIATTGAAGIHLDVMDGHFVPNLTFGPPVIAALRRRSTLFFDVHLMVQEPERLLTAYLDAGVQRITIHQEATPHLHRVVQQIRARGVQVGVAINPATAAQTLDAIADDVDMILVMTVNPGFGGQQFLISTLPKLRYLRARRGPDFSLMVDGGINKTTASQAVAAGANELVAGTAIFGQKDRQAAVLELQQQAMVHPNGRSGVVG